MELALELKPVSLIGFGDGAEAAAFTAMNPATGSPLEPKFFAASTEDLERAAALAQSAFPVYSKLSGKKKAAFLRQIAAAIEAAAPAIIKRANLETALPEARLTGEVGRTCGQLRLFAEVVEEGSWVDARIDNADPNRKPLPSLPSAPCISRLARSRSSAPAISPWLFPSPGRHRFGPRRRQSRHRQGPSRASRYQRAGRSGHSRERQGLRPSGRRILHALRRRYRCRCAASETPGNQSRRIHRIACRRYRPHEPRRRPPRANPLFRRDGQRKSSFRSARRASSDGQAPSLPVCTLPSPSAPANSAPSQGWCWFHSKTGHLLL